MIDEQQVVEEMRSAHSLLGQSNAELGRKLAVWQQSLVFGKFKRAYLAAGWTKSEVDVCLRAFKNQQLASDNCSSDSADYKEVANPHFSSESDEWYTPEHIVQGVKNALGSIDLDPCSNTQKSVPASAHFTKEDDGLTQSWAGNVYMNPPYGAVIGDWVEKLVQEYNSGNVKEAVALVPARVDTEWFRKLTGCVVVFVSGRLHFSNSENAAPFPSALVYLGNDRQKFKEAFAEVGRAWVEF